MQQGQFLSTVAPFSLADRRSSLQALKLQNKMNADKYLVLLPRHDIDLGYLDAAPQACVTPAPSEADIIHRLSMKKLRKDLDPALAPDEPRGTSLKRSASEAIEPTDPKRTTRGPNTDGSRQGLVVSSDLPVLPTSYEAVRWISQKDKDDLIASFIPKATSISTNHRVDDNLPSQNIQEHRRAAKQNKPLSSRVCRPVAKSPPVDVWILVLQLCDLASLLKARMVCRDFSSMLECAMIWKGARQRIYGPDCPDPPANLTEWQYADLLANVGCQAKNCADKKAKKVYWMMQRRWCEKCWTKRTLRASALRGIAGDDTRIPDCVPHFTYDNWRRHHYIGSSQDAPAWIRVILPLPLGFERRAVRNMMSEIDSLIGRSQDEKDEWFSLRQLERDRLQSELVAVERFFWTRKRAIRQEERRVEKARKAFFREKAISMKPPMRPEVLRLTSAFHRAVAICAKPTESSWQALIVGVEQERREAEILANIDAIAHKASKKEFKKLEDRVQEQDQRMSKIRRDRQPSSVLSLVLRVAELVMNHYLGVTKMTSNGVADEDLIPLILKEFYACWYQLGEGPELDGKPIAGYDLILEDASMIVYYVIEPVIKSWDNPHRKWTARELKCPACRNHVACRSFEDQILHIVYRHTKTVGPFVSWRPTPSLGGGRSLDCNDLYRIRWPANLPILPASQKATGHWNLDTWTEPPRLPAPEVVVEEPRPDAFANRYASSYIGPHYQDFVENIIFAADAVKNLDGLSNGLKTLMALKYADMKYPATDTDKPTFAHLCNMQVELVRHGFEELFEDFICGLCDEWRRRRYDYDDFIARCNIPVSPGWPLGDMITHFTASHSQQVWTKGLFLLPSGEDLSKALANDREAAAVFDRLFPLNVSLGMRFLSANALVIVNGVVIKTCPML